MDVEKYIDFKKTRNFGSETEIWPINEVQETFNKLIILRADPRVQGVYLREDIPDSLHFKNNRRTAPILIIMKEGFQIVSHDVYIGSGGLRGKQNKKFEDILNK